MKIKILLPLIMLLSALNACTHSIHLVHSGDFERLPVSESNIVTAKAEQTVILGFVFDTDYVDHAKRDLESKCPHGTLHGITTQISTDHSFFHWTNVALMKGYCVNGS